MSDEQVRFLPELLEGHIPDDILGRYQMHLQDADIPAEAATKAISERGIAQREARSFVHCLLSDSGLGQQGEENRAPAESIFSPLQLSDLRKLKAQVALGAFDNASLAVISVTILELIDRVEAAEAKAEFRGQHVLLATAQRDAMAADLERLRTQELIYQTSPAPDIWCDVTEAEWDASKKHPGCEEHCRIVYTVSPLAAVPPHELAALTIQAAGSEVVGGVIHYG
ncbi:hypothetical protein [Nissabacter sp. SGAir0207]|uniref:hypothetical protein n=1 Tax=Nissabacter sp. SGAir0207 TaxID=2126321 RepID=UPI0010CCF614|nr:hypothetical protein [Nissabacter sp. SGAir0207]QCR38780.1 hypothetical protein C1N62_21890 [Nissabacter sp. SGAir0207]